MPALDPKCLIGSAAQNHPHVGFMQRVGSIASRIRGSTSRTQADSREDLCLSTWTHSHRFQQTTPERFPDRSQAFPFFGITFISHKSNGDFTSHSPGSDRHRIPSDAATKRSEELSLNDDEIAFYDTDPLATLNATGGETVAVGGDTSHGPT